MCILKIYDYDLIVAGGGLAGLIQLLHVLLKQQAITYSRCRSKSYSYSRKKDDNRLICGDAVGKKSVDYMTERIGIKWGHPEIEHP